MAIALNSITKSLLRITLFNDLFTFSEIGTRFVACGRGKQTFLKPNLMYVKGKFIDSEIDNNGLSTAWCIARCNIRRGDTLNVKSRNKSIFMSILSRFIYLIHGSLAERSINSAKDTGWIS